VMAAERMAYLIDDPGAKDRLLSRFVEQYGAPVVLTGRDRRR